MGNMITNNKTGIILWSAAGVMLLITLIAFSVKKAKEKVPDIPEKLAAVSVSTVERTDVTDITFVPGLLEAWSDVIVSTEAAGRIVTITKEKGSSVSKGDKLLGLDDRIQLQNVHRAELALADAERDFARITGLQETGAVSDSELDKVRVQRDLADVMLKEVRVLLSQCEVLSPLAGIIQDRFVSEGEYVALGVAAFRIVTADRLKVLMSVPESDVLGAKVGKQIPFTVASVPGRTFTGSILFVATAAEPGSNSFKVELDVSNADRALKPGMIASVEYERGILTDAISVPLSSLIPSKGEYIAYEIQNDAALRRVVKINAIVGDRAVIQSGLEAGASLVIDGHRKLEDGMRVTVVEPDSEAR
jgi:membrane fusion protein (multidrug efflux system)